MQLMSEGDDAMPPAEPMAGDYGFGAVFFGEDEAASFAQALPVELTLAQTLEVNKVLRDLVQ